MIRFILVGAVAIGASSSAAAAPVYLDCYLDTKHGRQDWSVSLNEEQSRVVASNPAATTTFNADFGPYVIEWGSDVAEFTIVRTNGTFMRMFKVPEIDLDTGRCALSTAKRVL